MEKLMKGVPMEEHENYENINILSESYLDPNFHENDFCYKYKKILNDQFLITKGFCNKNKHKIAKKKTLISN